MKNSGIKVIIFIFMLPFLLYGSKQWVWDEISNRRVDILHNREILKPCYPRDSIRQGTILWDTTHTPHLQYTPQGRYSDLVSMLADSGFATVADGQGVNNIDLSVYDVIVICLPSNWVSVYTGAEVNALLTYYDNGHQHVIQTSDANWCDNSYMHLADDSAFAYNVFEWLASAGGILIMSENTACPNENVRPVCQAFSMDCGLSYLSPSDLYFSNFAAHPIFNGVSQVYYRAAGELSASAPAQEIGWTSTNLATVGMMDEVIGIELTGFSASLIEGGILLEWTTASEFGNSKWYIERKEIGKEWKTIVCLPSNGNSPSGNRYKHSDTEVDFRKVYLYRLGNTNIDGKLEWLRTIRVEPYRLGSYFLSEAIKVQPNPFTDNVEISFGVSSSSIGIYDLSGRLVKDFSLNIKNSQLSTVVSWDGRDNSGTLLPGGMYFLVYKIDNLTLLLKKIVLIR